MAKNRKKKGPSPRKPESRPAAKKKTASKKSDGADPMKISLITGAAVLLVIVLILIIAAFTSVNPDEPQASEPGQSVSAAETIDSSKAYFADIDIKDYGTITVQLDPEAAPKTVQNFINLSESGFYNGLTFHRIIEDFMMQGGDPKGDGTGGSENTIVGEFSENGYENNLSHTRGTISMARSDDYDSASSQFFIVQKDSIFLDGSYAAFGQVTDGMDIVDTICTEAEPIDNNGLIATDAQPVINSITIRTEDIAE